MEQTLVTTHVQRLRKLGLVTSEVEAGQEQHRLLRLTADGQKAVRSALR
jgi:DNA-binding MarR family transcriptional regulator